MMTRFAMFIDACGLLCDDLWSYYEIAGRPFWAARAVLLLAPLSWLLFTGIQAWV